MDEHPYAGVSRALAGSAFGAIDYRTETGSTNADAGERLGDDHFAGLTIVAEYQLHGAGRKGRSWLAEPGSSLLFTTILPRTVAASDLWIVPFWVALAVRNGLQRCGISTEVHWPNDLLAGERKLSGILCTSRIVGNDAWVAGGVGINVRRSGRADAEIDPPPAFCDDFRAVDRAELLQAVLLEYEATLGNLAMPQRVARMWESCAGVPGKRYRILKDGESTSFDAVAMALETGGGLVVKRDDGVRETISLANARALRST